ncbi:MAG: 50S ribosomal protein L23 [Patescibacteria group bacterium]|jgi:large subunit ribosomal protein L23
MTNILKKPLISEKSYGQVENSVFTFIVSKKASKEEIAKECEDLFGVTVLAVNTVSYIGKVKRSKRGEGKRNDFKKALVRLKPGDKIALFEIEEAKEEKAKQTKEKKSEKKAE